MGHRDTIKYKQLNANTLATVEFSILHGKVHNLMKLPGRNQLAAIICTGRSLLIKGASIRPTNLCTLAYNTLGHSLRKERGKCRLSCDRNILDHSADQHDCYKGCRSYSQVVYSTFPSYVTPYLANLRICFQISTC